MPADEAGADGKCVVQSRLEALIDSRQLTRDPAQAECARRLDDLRNELIRKAAPSTGLAGVLRGLLRRNSRRHAPVRGLYIWGSVGRGKTLLMDLFHESLPEGIGRRSHFYRFMREVHARLGELRDQEDPLQQVAVGIAEKATVLCFDELFVSDIGDAMILGRLFDALFRQGVTLVATSNVPPEQLYQDGLQRQRFLPAIALLLRRTQVVRLEGPVDYRLRHLAMSGTWLDSTAADTPARMNQLFDTLSGLPRAAAATLSVEGRPISARRAAPDIVWFDFDAICDGPRSQNDYIDLAHDYHTVFISDVPVFDTGNEDAARRFVMLVDEFYDRGVKLVASAHSPPAALYRGERLRLEFGRTSSRLIEMQSADYLARHHFA